MNNNQDISQPASSSYNKKPLWQWIAIYIVIGGLIYGVIYYFYFASSKTNTPLYNNNQDQQKETNKDSMMDDTTMDDSDKMPDEITNGDLMMQNSVVMTRMKEGMGNYLTDNNGMALYIFDKDSTNQSTCSGSCLDVWPIFAAQDAMQENMPEPLGVTNSTTGANMYTWDGMPLYYYATDEKAGDIKGDGVGGIWHIIKITE